MYLGIDFGTSSVKASVIDAACAEIWHERLALAPGDITRPHVWRASLDHVLDALPDGIRRQLRAIAVDATSGTVFLCDSALAPQSPVLAYNDARATLEASEVADHCGAAWALPTSSIAKVLWLERHCRCDPALIITHQADWISAQLLGVGCCSDEHNTLKLGFDPARQRWIPGISALGIAARFPRVNRSGAPLGHVSQTLARQYGIAHDCQICAGTTDSIAAFLAAGSLGLGDAVTSLGSTLTLKMLCGQRIDAWDYGIYSHRFGDHWLVGGASNSGAGVLSLFFDNQKLEALSSRIDSNKPSSLNYYPLGAKGERFPLADPHLEPRLAPRPDSDVDFLHGLLEGIARIEQLGYDRLESLGTPPLARVFTSGGGALNPTWTAIRRRVLGREVAPATHTEAAYGTARLARFGTNVYKAVRMLDSERRKGPLA